MNKNNNKLTQRDLDRFLTIALEEAHSYIKAINDNSRYNWSVLSQFGPVYALLYKKDSFLLSLLDKEVTIEALNGISKANKNHIVFTNLNEEAVVEAIIKYYNFNVLDSVRDLIFTLLSSKQIPTFYYLNEYYSYNRDKHSVEDYKSTEQPNLLNYYGNKLKENYGLIKLCPGNIEYISQNPPRIYDSLRNISIFTYTDKKLTDLFNKLYMENPRMVISYRGKDNNILPFKFNISYIPEAMIFGKQFELNISNLISVPVSKFCSDTTNSDILYINVKDSEITFEELLYNFNDFNDSIITQVIHLMYYRDTDGSYKISHLDHEYIYYGIDSYSKRIDDPRIKGNARPRLKTFKLDNCCIPFDYPCKAEEDKEKFVPFLYYILDHYFKNKELLKEYFERIL